MEITNVLCLLLFIRCEDNIANTSEGLLRGYNVRARSGRTILGFSGIPYAKPPLGILRFQDPQPPDSWRGIRDAKYHGKFCVQHTYLVEILQNFVIGSEDCLYLSVYTPKLKPGKLYPVLIHIEGGGFEIGSQQFISGPGYFLDHDVVLVSFNYRVGPLGFLSMEDDIIPGNFGLKDQNMVLKWVQRNIMNFGGDPSKVTIMGESAGGASVHYHLLSPLSKDLFHRAISESGSALSNWAHTQPGFARLMAIKSAESLGCPTARTQNMLDCLRTKHPYEIARQQHNFTGKYLNIAPVFIPSPDPEAKEPFFPKDPHGLVADPVPWLTGCNNIDGLIKSRTFELYPNSYEKLQENFVELVPDFIKLTTRNVTILNKIRDFYFGNSTITSNMLKNITKMITDYWFVWPLMKSVRTHDGPLYLYYNRYEGKQSLQNIFVPYKLLKGAFHGDELMYLWDWELIFDPLKGRDLKFSTLLVQLWVNFATYGTPTPPGFKFIWPQWDKINQQYLKFNKDGSESIGSCLLSDHTQFWDNLKLIA